MWDPLPMFHMSFVLPLIACIDAGAALLSMEHFDATRAIDYMEREHATVNFASFPTITEALLNHPDYDESRLNIRLVNNVGPPELLVSMQERMGAAAQISAYGMTECFQNLSVRENLDLGLGLRSDGSDAIRRDRDRLLDLLPGLAEKIGDAASSLSGGQQQMLALARAMITRPRLLMIDELSFGLAPNLVDDLFELVTELRDEGGTTFLLVEQNASVLEISDRTYVLKTGSNDIRGPSSELKESHDLVRSYLGQ